MDFCLLPTGIRKDILKDTIEGNIRVPTLIAQVIVNFFILAFCIFFPHPMKKKNLQINT